MVKRAKRKEEDEKEIAKEHRLHPDTKKSIVALSFICLAAIFFLAEFEKAGPAGSYIYKALKILLGSGYFILPTALLAAAIVLLTTERQKVVGVTIFGAILVTFSTLGIINLTTENGGWLGFAFGSLEVPFGQTAAFVINFFIFLIGILTMLNVPLKIKIPAKKKSENIAIVDIANEDNAKREKPKEIKDTDNTDNIEVEKEETETEKEPKLIKLAKTPAKLKVQGKYVPPPLDLLKSLTEKPTTGNLRANANIIKRTLESFGIQVEMGEVNIGPKVTRYTLKPAEGVKLSRITALNQDLALALAAHPIRIEAPIPGKSLVGIEVPNKAAALVRLGSLIGYEEFEKSGPLEFVIGRDVTGEPVFADISKMPHLLIAGSTGSGKSVVIHSLLISLLYKNSPQTLRLILIDPKRVELSAYEGIPHLIGPVILESKKAINVFRWAINEMERRYDILLKTGSRDIKSYNSNKRGEPMPYILIVVDEMADLMTSYGREVEGTIVRLAQMARATGIHLILSTQRPSVEIITGLIKANITSRIALQVASQVDSRTILDTSGAEKLLGGGDLLFISSELSKPKRIQGAYVPEEEVKKVTEFIKENNSKLEEAEPAFEENAEAQNAENIFDEYDMDEEDELYNDALGVVLEAKKASASLLQRRLKVGYARAARLLDIMEKKGIISPAKGAKPREILVDRNEQAIV